MSAEIAAQNHSPSFDPLGNSTVDLADLDSWLAEAGNANLPSGALYPRGDANPDGATDGTDFNIWNTNKFSNVSGRCDGDFNADGVADGVDFSIWNAHKFTTADNGNRGLPPGEGTEVQIAADSDHARDEKKRGRPMSRYWPISRRHEADGCGSPSPMAPG